MRKRTESLEVKLRREELCPGIFLEHFQKRLNEKDYYLLKVESQVFKILDLTIDLHQSANIEMPDCPELVKKVKIEPFTKATVAKIVLLKKWAVNPKFSFKLSKPPIDMQKKLIAPYNTDLERKIEQFRALAPIDFKSFSQEAVLDFFQRKKLTFVDLEFPPVGESLCLDLLFFESKFKMIHQWRRAKYLYYPAIKANQSSACPPTLFSHEFRRSVLKSMQKASSAKFLGSFDMKQPSVETQSILEQEYLETEKHNLMFLSNEGLDPGVGSHDWMTVAFIAIKSHPDLLRYIFFTNKPNPYGYYLLKLHVMGRKSVMQLDDFIPCSPFGDPLFLGKGQDPKPDFGFFLLEKAFAKRRGSYYRLGEGNIASCLADLTGAPVLEFFLDDPSNKDADLLWKRVDDWVRRNYVVVVEQHDEADEEVPAVTKSKLFETKRTKNEYFILHGTEVDENGTRIVKLSMQPRLHTKMENKELEEMAQEDSHKRGPLQPTLLIGIDLSPQELPVPFSSFQRNFHKIVVAKTYYKEKLRVKGKFVSRSATETVQFQRQNFISRWIYKIELKATSNVTVGLHQEDESWVGVRETRPNIDLGLVVYKEQKDSLQTVHFLPSNIRREVFCELELAAGTYIITPLSFGIYNKDESLMQGITSHDKTNPIVMSVVSDIFEKLNMSGNDLLSLTELKNFYKVLELGNLSELDYFRLIAKYSNSGVLQAKDPQGLSERAFSELFFDLLEANKNKKPNDKNFFQALGYDETLYSVSSRIFTLTLHSDKYIEIDWKDNFKEGKEADLMNELLENFGRRVATFCGDDQVYPLAVVNEWD